MTLEERRAAMARAREGFFAKYPRDWLQRWIRANREEFRESLVGRRWRFSHCKRGHPMTDENVYVSPDDGRRRCRTCQRAAGAARRARVKASRS